MTEMARASTLPISAPRNSTSSRTPINRAGTTLTQAPQPTSNTNRQSRGFFSSADKQNAYSPAVATTSTASNPTSTPRPNAPLRQNSIQTRYMEMLLAMDTIPRLHNILSSFFTWILLAGFIIFPGTFTTINKLDSSQEVQDSQAAKALLASVKNIPLLVIAGVCAGIGAAGMIWLWWRWRGNYVWLLNKIFLPGFLNSFAGLISTLVNVYTQQSGLWSVTAEVTAIVTGAMMAVTGVLFALYNFWVLERVKRRHGREMEFAMAAEHEGETLVEKVERKAMEPALEPGSVV